MLKFLLDSLDGVDESLHSLYTKTSDGKYKLTVDGMPDDAETRRKLDAMRDNNRGLHKTVEELQGKLKTFDNVTPEMIEQAQNLANQVQEEEEKKLIKEGKIDELLQRRTTVMRDDFAKQTKQLQDSLEGMKKTNTTLKDQLAAMTVDHEIRRAIDGEGLKPRSAGALEDIIRRARDTWKIGEDGKMGPVDSSGGTRYGANGEPLTMKEYVTKDLATSASHLFEGSGGGGAQGGGGTGPALRKVNASDPLEFGRHLDDIADGKVDATPSEG